MSGHLLLTDLGPVEAAIIERTVHAEVPSVLIVDDVTEAGLLHDEPADVAVVAVVVSVMTTMTRPARAASVSPGHIAVGIRRRHS